MPLRPCPLRFSWRKTRVHASLIHNKLVILMLPASLFSIAARRPLGAPRPVVLSLAVLSLFLFPGSTFGSGAPQAQSPQAPAPTTKTQPPAGKAGAKTSAQTSGKAHSTKHHRSKTNSSARRARVRAQRAPTPERISEIQAALAAAGHYSGQPTGKLDASTIQSVKHYQAANGLPATGKLDARTLQKLGLGSPIAGAAPPRPSSSSTSPASSAPPRL